MPATLPLARHARETLALALPVTVARAGMLAMATADVIMTGRAGADELAHFALAYAPHMTLLLASIGLLQGTGVLVAQAFGAGRPGECGAYWRLASIHAVALGVALALAMALAAAPFFRLIGQDEPMAAGAGRVLGALAWGMPGFLLFAATSYFLEAVRRPLPGMVAMLLANAANIGLNALLIDGRAGMPALGAEGAAHATSAVRTLMAAGLFAYVALSPSRRALGIGAPLSDARLKARKLRALGYPIGLTFGLESAAITALVLMAGLHGAIVTASYQIAHNLMALAYMPTIGFATAAAVRVGHAVGAGRHNEAVRAGTSALILGLALAAGLGLLYGALGRSLAGLYSDEPAVVATAAPLIAIIALALVVDSIQGVLIGAARGTGSVWIPSAIHLGAYWGVAVPAGYALSFALNLGAPGLLWGLTAGFTAASLGLLVHLRSLARRPLTALVKTAGV